MEFGWTEEQQMWRKAVRDFAQKEITPRVREMDTTGKIPEEIIRGMADMGLLAPTVSEEYGGMEASWVMACIAAEELGRADISIAVPVLYLVEAGWGFIFDRYGTKEAKEEILPKVISGDFILGIGATEPGGGSDIIGATRTRATKDGQEWVLNGEKMYISGIAESLERGGIHLTLAKTDPSKAHKGMSMFALPLKDTPGITPTLLEDMGRMGISTGGFAMEDVRLPEHYLVGEESGKKGAASTTPWRDSHLRGVSSEQLASVLPKRVSRSAWTTSSSARLSAAPSLPSRASSSLWPSTTPTSRVPGCSPTGRPGCWTRCTKTKASLTSTWRKLRPWPSFARLHRHLVPSTRSPTGWERWPTPRSVPSRWASEACAPIPSAQKVP